MPTHSSLLRDSSFSVENASNITGRWVLIVNWPGLERILKYLQSPSAFVVEDGRCFEDIIVKEYCKQFIRSYSGKAEFRSKLRKSRVKEEVLMQFESVRRKRNKEESYLSFSFSEDVRRSRGEILKILSAYREK
jgi:hypothetical protein